MCKRIISVGLGLLTLLLTIFTLGRAVQAATINTIGLTGSEATVTDRYGNVITDPSDLSKWQNYEISYDWDIPNGQKIQVGDTAPVTLPGNTVASSDLSFDLKDDTGATIGTFTIKAGESTGTITFTEQLIGTNDREGTLKFYAKGTSSSDTNHQDWALNKVGWVSGSTPEGTPTRLTWNVAFNPSGKDLGTVTVQDTIGPNQTYMPGTVTADTGSYNAAGEFVSNGVELQPQVTVNGQQLTFVFENVTTAVNMTYNVQLNHVSANGGSWENDASMDGTVVSGHVTWGGSGTGNGGPGEPGPGTEDDLGAFTLVKSDAKTGSALAGAVYELRDKSGLAIQSGLTTDQNGKLFVSDLAAGDYSLVETQAPTGYDLNAQPIPLTIVAGDTTPVQLTQTDEPIVVPPKTGGFTLIKTATGTDERLAGAIYDLQDAAGKVVKSGLTTDKNGELTVTELPVGDYQLIETQAPSGYEVSAEPIKVTITADQMTPVTVTATDELLPVVTKGEVQLTKTDDQTGTTLAGAEYELQDAQGKVIKTGLTTDAEGQLTVTDLAAGDYRFVEMKAPTDYELNATPLTFTVTPGQTTLLTVTAKDTKLPTKPSEPEPPVTPEPPVEPEVPEPSEPTQPVIPEPDIDSTAPETGGNSVDQPNLTAPSTVGTPSGTIDGNPIGRSDKTGLPQTNEKSDDETLASVAGVSIMMIVFAIGSWEWRRNRN